MTLDKPFVFKHLSNANCPHCGAGVKSCSITGEHTNGDQFEEVTYDCGYKVAYVPNFRRTEDKAICSRSRKAGRISEIREKMIQSIARMVKRHKLSDTSSSSLNRELAAILRHIHIEEE